MVLEETLKHHFQTLGVNLDDKAVLGKCMDLCDLYNVNEEILVEMWVAFMVEKNLGTEPTLADLNQMERTVLKPEKKLTFDVERSSAMSMSTSESPRSNQNFVDNEDILEMYGFKGQAPREVNTEPRSMLQVTSQGKRLRSPDGADVSIARESKIRALDVTSSQSSDSPTPATPRRILSGKSGSQSRCGREVRDWKNANKMEVRIAKSEDPHVDPQPTYMFELLSKKISNMNLSCREFGARLCAVWSKTTGEEPPPTTSNVRMFSQTNYRTWGRIKSADEETLTNTTIMLEGCKSGIDANETCNVQLDLTKVESYSIFPGQIVAVEGTNPAGNTLLAQKIFTSRSIPALSKPELEENLHMMIAAGPFTDRENLEYKPLFQLMDTVVEMEPHVLVMIGPFVPADHKVVREGAMNETFQELFERIIEKVMRYTKGTCTQVVLIPSADDAHHDPVYPTPEFFIPKSMQTSNLHLMTDPCMLDIEGLTIGITSVDIVRHLCKEEISQKMARAQRLPRMMEHLLSQGCFYPLYPPPKEVNLDTGLWKKFAMMHQRPHILIVPSDMQHFCSWLDDNCLAINPERLSKQTYVRMIVRPSFGKTWSSDYVDCEVLKM